ncbi:MAG: serine/threonine protein kinase [Planctomycetaceae bacterium]|nr:serine/threonine protein kinase [Planctomycetaceae bacterium]
MHESTLDPLTIYCPACNEGFLGRLRDPVCPRCGMSALPPDDTTMPTIVFRTAPDVLSSASGTENTRDSHLLNLLGTEFDHYHIETVLGRGGMGTVFLARHRELTRSCALKILSPTLLEKDPEYLDRFRNEGQHTAVMNHPNIVTVHNIGAVEDLHFLEMEFVPGRSLQRIVKEQTLMPLRAATVSLGIANGLAAAHRVGIIHRDLKPDNVLMTHNGIPKLADFGLAKKVRGSSIREVPGTLAGTPHFMAPELFSGHEATPASDVYALGVTLFFMLSGELPFARSSMNDLIAAVTNDKPAEIRGLCKDIPLELCECLGLLLEKSPENRPKDGIEAAQLLLAILGQTRDLESLMREAFEGESSVDWKRDGDRYRAQVLLPDGRGQAVFIENSQHGVADRLLQIYSLCCPAMDHYYEEALRLNSSLAHGAIAIRQVDGQDYFVTLNSYPRGTADADAIRRSVLEMAMRADAVEYQLTGEDIH